MIARFAIACLIAMAAAAAATCGGETAVETLVGPDGVRCQTTVGAPSAPVAPSGGTVNVTITAARDCTWTATSEASWMQLNATSGQGNATLGVTVAQNDVATARSGAIAVNNQRVTITQQPRPCTYGLRASPQNLGADGGRGSISIDTLTGCTWTAVSSAAWLRVLTATGSGSGSAEFEVAANTGDHRQAAITIGGQAVTITQDARNQPGGGGGGSCSITLAPSTVNAAAAGGTHTVAVTASSGCDWTATTSSAQWLTVSPDRGSGNGPLTLTVARNNGGARTATVTVAGQTATVNQAAAPVCTATIDSASATVPAAGGERSVRVTTQEGCEWTATGGDPSWTQIATPRGTGTSDARYSVARHTGTSPRSTTLTIAGHSHTVTQEAPAAPTCTYTVQPGSQDFPAAGGPLTVSVTTQPGCTWTANSNQGWAQITGTSSNSFTYSVPQNGGGPRQATITVTGASGGSAQHNVTQQAQVPTCSYSVSPNSQDFPPAGGTLTVTVTTQQGCTWTANSNQGWAQITGTSSNSFTYSVPQNGGGPRQATITVTGTSGGSAQHSLTQQPQPPPACTYQLTSGSQNFPANGGSFTFTVNTQNNCNWQAQAADPWVNISSGSGSGSQPVSYSVQPNPSTSSRSTSISITNSNVSHTVTQAGMTPPCSYTLQPGSQPVPAAGGTFTFSVATQQGCAWTASAGGTNWITNVTQSGNSVSYTVQANGTGAQRQGSITVSGGGGSASHTVTQSQ